MAETSHTTSGTPATTGSGSQQMLLNELQQARLHLDAVVSQLGGEQLSSEALAALPARLAAANSGCNTSCGRARQ
jgi:hypothetical protein